MVDVVFVRDLQQHSSAKMLFCDVNVITKSHRGLLESSLHWNAQVTVHNKTPFEHFSSSYFNLDDVFWITQSLIKVNEADKLSHFFHALQAENCGARQDIFLKLP